MRPLKFLLGASLVLPAAVAGAVGLWSYNQTLEEAELRARQTATILREHALRVFEAQESAITSIDGRIAGLSWDEIEQSAAVHEVLRSMRDSSPHIDGLWLVRPEGWAANSADFFPMPPTSPSKREYFRVLQEQDVTHLGEMIRGYLKGNLNFNLSRRRSSPDGSFDGLILVTISLAYFESFWRNTLGDAPHVAAILREDGKILARYPGLEQVPGQIPADSPFFSLIGAQHETGSYGFQSGADGRERIYSFAKLGTFPAYMGIGLDRETILAPWRRQFLIMAAVAAAITLALTLMAQTALKRQILLRQEIVRRREVESSLIAKEEHVAALERAEAELRQSEERFRSLFESLTEGVLYFDADGRIVSGNAASEEILGLTSEDLKGRRNDDPRWMMVESDGRSCPVDQQPSVVALRTGRIVRERLIGVHNPTRDERRWLKITAIPQRKAHQSRPIGVFCIFSDVTEQLRTEQAQGLLIREVDHRAKNALAVVQAILRLTKAATVRDFVKAVEGRVAAMAKAHTLLANSRWEGADLKALIEEELAPYRPAEGAYVRIEGPPLVMQTDATQAFGMVIHELATNAVKYGGLSNSDGALSVTWSTAEEDGGLKLRWAEVAGRKVAPPSERGFGSTLIQSTIKGQLGGDLQIEWLEAGMVALIRVPSRHVARSATSSARASVPEQPVRSVQLSGHRVLVAEDNASIALELVQVLEELGCTVVGPAAALDEAARLAIAQPIDIAVLDVDLQGKAIFPVAELLASLDVPIIFCTGFGDLDPSQHRLDGRVAIVRKPFSRHELTRALNTVLAPEPAAAAVEAEPHAALAAGSPSA